MALTKISRGLLDTGVSDSSDATAITIDSSENVGIGTASPSSGGGWTPKLVLDATSAALLVKGVNSQENSIGSSNGMYIDSLGSTTASNNRIIFRTTNTNSNFSGAERMRITSAGNVGIGTTSPSSDLHVSNGGAEGIEFYAGNASNVNTFQHYNRSTSNYVDAKHIANNHIFQSGGTEVFRTSGSNVGIGTTGQLGGSWDAALNVSNDNNSAFFKSSGGGGYAVVGIQTGTYTSTTTAIVFYNGSGGTAGSISLANGNTSTSVSYNTSSDYRLKENVVTDWDATTRLKQLRPSRFNFISDVNTTVDGFLAHEVSDIVPEAITGTKDATETLTNVVRSAQGVVLAEGVTEAEWTAGKANAVLWTEEDELPEGVSVGDVRNEATYPSDSTWAASHTRPVYQSIDQSKLVPLLVKTIQELEARITTLENA